MIIGIGVDLCSVERLSNSIQRTPALAARLFTAKEQNLKDESLAARFAAKEALAKAVGNPKLLSWLEVEVETDRTRQAEVGCIGQKCGDAEFHGSLVDPPFAFS